jgi:hypothetical protein
MAKNGAHDPKEKLPERRQLILCDDGDPSTNYTVSSGERSPLTPAAEELAA